MASSRSIRSRRHRFLLPLCAMVVTAYFGWHAYTGAHGLLNRDDLKREQLRLAAELKGLQSRRDDLERNIELLRPDSLDPDYLEERAIRLLNFSHEDVRELRPEGARVRSTE